MRIKLYGAQVNAGPLPRPYVRTQTAQDLTGVGPMVLTWGADPGYEPEDPAWTERGAQFAEGDRLTGDRPLPAEFTLSAVLRPRFPSAPGWLYRAEGGAGLWLDASGELAWGDDADATTRLGVFLPTDVYSHIYTEWAGGRLSLWLDGVPLVKALLVAVADPALSAPLIVGGTAFDLGLLTVYAAGLPRGAAQHVDRFTRVLSQDLDLPRADGARKPAAFRIVGYGEGYTEVEVRDDAETRRILLYTIGGQQYVMPYLEITD